MRKPQLGGPGEAFWGAYSWEALQFIIKMSLEKSASHCTLLFDLFSVRSAFVLLIFQFCRPHFIDYLHSISSEQVKGRWQWHLHLCCVQHARSHVNSARGLAACAGRHAEECGVCVFSCKETWVLDSALLTTRRVTSTRFFTLFILNFFASLWEPDSNNSFSLVFERLLKWYWHAFNCKDLY